MLVACALYGMAPFMEMFLVSFHFVNHISIPFQCGLAPGQKHVLCFVQIFKEFSVQLRLYLVEKIGGLY
jgi:hypothetical protein